MACCLIVQSYYQNQCWLIILSGRSCGIHLVEISWEFSWYQSWYEFEKYQFKITVLSHLPGPLSPLVHVISDDDLMTPWAWPMESSGHHQKWHEPSDSLATTSSFDHTDPKCYTVLAWGLHDHSVGMTGLLSQSVWWHGPNLDWGYLNLQWMTGKSQCISGSRDWEFLLFSKDHRQSLAKP